ncbi:MAG: hypothetical protein QOI78_5268 [Actinomycetota bacterium]|nr:hypothetical protein [Actinomycetota bacterium]
MVLITATVAVSLWVTPEGAGLKRPARAKSGVSPHVRAVAREAIGGCRVGAKVCNRGWLGKTGHGRVRSDVARPVVVLKLGEVTVTLALPRNRAAAREAARQVV